MNCATCEHDNPSGNRFCGGCGAALVKNCPSCSQPNPPDHRFCGGCGTALDDARPDTSPRPSPSPRPTPPPAAHPATEPPLPSRSALDGERKQVTVLFADVKGSMEMAEQMDPEEWSAIMQRFFAVLSEGVRRFDGYVDKFTGDGIMALFGAPVAHEDHAQRACYAALHLRDALKGYADELRRTAGVSLSVRIGLNSGEVVVGSVGGDQRIEYTAQGHTVGLAQRMEQRAAADSIYLTEHTATHVRGYFELRDLGGFDLKGASAPVAVSELLGVGALKSRLDRSRARGFSRLVGRSEELATLQTAMDQALEGRGPAVGVVADAGVGKSRLCMEFVENCRGRGISVYEAHCLSHGSVVPLLPIFELFRGYFGITPRDDDQFAREKVAGRMLLLDRQLEPYLPLVFEFLGIADPQQPAPTMEPAVRQRTLFEFTRRLIQARSQREPAVLFVDDAHWIDEGSDAFLEQIADIVAGTRTMLLLNFRPEYSATWMDNAFYRQLALRPLGDEDIEELLSSLLGSHSSLAGLPKLIRERTAGNPFFIEEIVHTLVESGALAGSAGAYQLQSPIDELEIPPTVHGILAARIDRLAEREKLLLQVAAIIGRKFSEELLREVSDLTDPEFDAAAAALRNAEFIQEEALYPRVEYSFRHPLTHEVAERSQLVAHRRRTHLAVARALERLHAGKADENAALLAHHWDLGGNADLAARWHARAALWIAGGNSAEARRHWQRVRDLADQVADPAVARNLGEQSRLMLLEYGWRLGMNAEEANELVSEGEAWAKRNHDPRALAALYNAFSIPCAFCLGENERARQLTGEGLRLAIQEGDNVLACALRLRLYFVAFTVGSLSETTQAIEAVLHHSMEDQRGASVLVGYDVPATIVGYREAYQVWAGNPDRALESYRRGSEIADANGATEVTSWMLWQSSIAWLAKGDHVRAEQSARAGAELAEKTESLLCHSGCVLVIGSALRLKGEAAAAIPILEEVAVLLARTGKYVETEALSELALARCAVGDLSRATDVAEQALDVATRIGSLPGNIRAHCALAMVRITHGSAADLLQAKEHLDVAQELIERSGQRVFVPHLDELRGRAAKRASDSERATSWFRDAQRGFLETGAPLHAERLAAEFNL